MRIDSNQIWQLRLQTVGAKLANLSFRYKHHAKDNSQGGKEKYFLRAIEIYLHVSEEFVKSLSLNGVGLKSKQ